jgi:hypothetical protein
MIVSMIDVGDIVRAEVETAVTTTEGTTVEEMTVMDLEEAAVDLVVVDMREETIEMIEDNRG